MPENKSKGNPQSKSTQRDQQKPIKDLDTRKADMDRVKGGRAARASSDPCEGGE